MNRLIKRHVYFGRRGATASGLDKRSLAKTKRNKVVFKNLSILGKQRPWIRAVSAARKELKLTGFVPVKLGGALYCKVVEICQQIRISDRERA